MTEVEAGELYLSALIESASARSVDIQTALEAGVKPEDEDTLLHEKLFIARILTLARGEAEMKSHRKTRAQTKSTLLSTPDQP